MTMRAQLLALTFAVTTMATFGCDSKKESKADEAAPSASREAQDKATEAEAARGQAKTEAASAQEAADADAAKAHKVVADQLQGDFDASDRRFHALEEKAAKATGAKKKNADARSAEVTKREATAMASIAKLRDATGAGWDTMKTQVSADTAALNKAIDALEATLQ
jgi:hypothetical protein